MPRSGPGAATEWLDAYLSAGVTPTLDGELENTPHNKIADAALQDLTPDGGTKTMRVLKGKTLDGYHFYSTGVGGKQSALVKQTGLPRLPKNNTRLEDEPIVITGQRPPAPFDPSLPQLTVRKIPLADSKQGFAGGWRLASVGLRNRATGAYTTTTEPVAFQHGNGQRIKWYPGPDETVPAGPWEWVFFLSEEAATEATLRASTMREQDRAPKGTREKTAKGPFERKNKKRPLVNETFIGRPGRLSWGGDLKMRGAPGDMVAMANVSISLAYTFSRERVSLASIRSRERDLAATKDRALFVDPKKAPRDATGVFVFVHIGGVSYRVIRPNVAYKQNPFPLGEKIAVYGDVAAEGEAAGAGGRRGPTQGHATVLVPEDPPEEDTSGIEPPTGETDAPVGVGTTRPAAGAYWKTYSVVYGGIEERSAVPVKVTVGTSELAHLEIPNPVNRLTNPAGTARGADGLPLAWAANTTNGVRADQMGKIGVATSGLVNDTTAYPPGSPSGAPYYQSDFLPVNQGVVETVRGVLEVSDYAGTTGHGRHFLVQQRADGTLLVTTLAERNSNGPVSYAKTTGPPGSGADVILDEGATDIALRIGTGTSSGRSMAVRGSELAVHPFRGAPRRFVFPPEGAAEILGPDVPPEAPYPPGPVVGITRPRSAAPPPEFVPVEDLRTDPTSAGWTANRTPLNANTVLEFANNRFRAKSDATGARAHAYYSKTYPIGTGAGFVNGSSLAVRGPFSFPVVPTRYANVLVYLAVLDANGNYMGYAHITYDGRLVLVARDRSGYDKVTSFLSGISPSDVADCEVIVGGGDTARGRVSFVGSVGGESRQELASVEGVDFRGRVPRQVRFLGAHERDTAGRWEVTCEGYLRVTSSGDVVEEFSPAEMVPDRPVGADASYFELDEYGEPVNQGYIHIPPSFEGEERGFVWEDFFLKPELGQTNAVYARWEDLAPQDADTVRLTVFDAAGNPWYAPSLLPSAAEGTSAGWVDLVEHLTPPPGHFRARLEVLRKGSGMLVIQLPLLTDGTI